MITHMLIKLKTNPLAYIVWIILSCAVHILLLKSKINFDYQVLHRIITGIIAVCFTLPAHELLHFIFMKMFCKDDVKIKILKSPIGLPTLATVSEGKFQKWQSVIIYLAPFVCLTILFDIVFLFCSKAELIFFVISLCNCAGCFYDIVDALIILNKKS